MPAARSSLFNLLSQRLADGADAAPSGFMADHAQFAPAEIHAAAVLIAITDGPEPSVLLTKRAEHLRQHPGQIAFPGGRVDAGENADEAALREAEEELAIPASAVQIIGQTDQFITGTGYAITPVIGLIPEGLDLTPNPAEVASWFAPSLHHMLNPANHAQKTRIYRGVERPNVEIGWQDHVIWGVTAAIFVNLSRRLDWVNFGTEAGYE